MTRARSIPVMGGKMVLCPVQSSKPCALLSRIHLIRQEGDALAIEPAVRRRWGRGYERYSFERKRRIGNEIPYRISCTIGRIKSGNSHRSRENRSGIGYPYEGDCTYRGLHVFTGIKWLHRRQHAMRHIVKHGLAVFCADSKLYRGCHDD